MRFPSASCLLCRHRVLLKTSFTQKAVISPSRAASSFSAIHNGLRQSHKSKPQGFNPSSLETAKPRRTTGASHRKEGKDKVVPEFRIKKGKKDITYTGPKPQSRRSRFNDPEKNFGKRSLVYQMKHGELRGKMAELDSQGSNHWTPSPRRASSDRLTTADFMKDFNSSPGDARGSPKGRGHDRGRASPSPGGKFAMQRSRASTRGQDNGRAPPVRDERFATRERESRTKTRDFDNESDPTVPSRRFKRLESGTNTRDRGSTRASPVRDGRFAARESHTNMRDLDGERTRRPSTPLPEAPREAVTNAPPFGARHEPSTTRPEQPSRFHKTDEKDGRREEEGRKFDDGPIRIHHTTAASQFLYGRFVVEAALKNSGRQLYRLYIYSGDDRQNLSQDDTLAKLAYQKGVKVQKVPNDGLRMMDKMSGGRPHNGCVLEASPLPQLPLKALGPISEDPKSPGYHVEIAHQSSEEGKINGTSDFVSYQLPKERKPFILLLDGILDPGNLGAILRTAAFLGVNGIAITKGSSATLTAVALKASAGAAEVMTLFSVSSTLDFLTRSKENGWLVYAAVPSTKRSKGNSHLTVDRVETYDPLSSQPTVLVIGSEGEGLTKQVRRQADHEVSIPSPAGGFSDLIDSLNVSVATGILCAAFLKKQSSGMMAINEAPSESGNEGDSQLW
ncbi:RNA methyltransferase [Nemania sp. FL0031]|nr:RNA methyltransferase [Nemania sp. FL0031]